MLLWYNAECCSKAALRAEDCSFLSIASPSMLRKPEPAELASDQPRDIPLLILTVTCYESKDRETLEKNGLDVFREIAEWQVVP